MKNLIKKILKEEFDWIEDVRQFTPVEEFLYDLMSSLTIVESKKQINWVVYKNENGEILMADNINTGTKNPVLLVAYIKIWEKLQDYGLETEDIKALCVRMLEVTHKRKVLTAILQAMRSLLQLEVTHKQKVLTTYIKKYQIS
jgi:phage regulator Rha-like protein